jgi:hypothetical protein
MTQDFFDEKEFEFIEYVSNEHICLSTRILMFLLNFVMISMLINIQ